LGLGYWNITDPQHPNYQPISRSASRTAFRFTPGTYDSSESSSSSTASAHTPESVHEPNSPAVTEPNISLDTAVATIELNQTENPDVEMSANVTTTGGTGSTGTPPNGGLKGIAPGIFNGDRSRSDAFWNEFRRYRLLNRNNESINVPFYRVLTALSYIKGPLVEDWVNAQSEELEKRIDTSRHGYVTETNEILWQEFESAFRSAWKDTARTQSAYDQLRKLAMRDLDIDTYNATFERLASAAEWEPDAKGTIARYREGLRENIHRRIVNRENMPTTMAEWKEAARKEVNRVKELQSAGLIGPRRAQTTRDQHAYQSNQRVTSNNRNNEHVPMDVDAINTSLPFKKLTDEERAKYRTEGRCFRCRETGHMARNCPKNSNANNSNRANPKARESTTSPAIVTTTPTTIPPPVPPKLSYGQQIRALEEKMTEEERAAYLDARDMGEDFCSAGF